MLKHALLFVILLVAWKQCHFIQIQTHHLESVGTKAREQGTTNDCGCCFPTGAVGGDDDDDDDDDDGMMTMIVRCSGEHPVSRWSAEIRFHVISVTGIIHSVEAWGFSARLHFLHFQVTSARYSDTKRKRLPSNVKLALVSAPNCVFSHSAWKTKQNDLRTLLPKQALLWSTWQDSRHL